jgi:tRNA G10  N-methylase Trm11
MKRMPDLDFSFYRRCVSKDASQFRPPLPVDTIITSPPYMRQLDYGRDNRLRLWFLGAPDWKALDDAVTPGEADFLALMRRCLTLWREILPQGGHCVLVFGDTWSRVYRIPLPHAVSAIALREVRGYSLLDSYTDSIPDVRRVRRNCRGNRSETIIVLKKR